MARGVDSSVRENESSIMFNQKKLTVFSLISGWAIKKPEAVAIEAIESPPLTYNQLYNNVRDVVDSLNSMGIGRNDRVAVVLPNGAEMAVTFLALSSGATCAPLNPAYKEKEFDFFLSDLDAKALIIHSEQRNSPALNVAEKKGIRVIILHPQKKEGAGLFTLEAEFDKAPTTGGFAGPHDTALVLHTSGTTSRPKIVPLKHVNICASAYNIGSTLRLSGKDRCLNVMPLFHIHGLIGALLSSISAGASVVCTPGFYATKFLGWLKKYQPTWYSAVPTMHQSILSRVKTDEDIIKHHTLRLIRSSSSALPPKIMAGLEEAFGIPVIESYGMTEASHQMTSNPLPPKKRKEGSVGVPSGPEVSIMDDMGNLLPQGEIGEIVIRGLNVTEGYENNPEANEEAYTNGWFRTGDQGYFDEEDYLFIEGRIKEIINRGGEKISPREIDEVLLDHPNIQQAVAFAVPDPKLGEEVGAAVVPRRNTSITKWEIQEFVSRRIAEFKVPRHVLILKEIPKGPTGKMQRIGLAEKLGLLEQKEKEVQRHREYRPPKTPTETTLYEIWLKLLDVDEIGIDENFFQLGGDSIIAGQIISKISEKMKIKNIPLVIFLHAPTIEKMADFIDHKRYDLPPASLVTIQPNGKKPPLYFVHACEGEILFYNKLSSYLGEEQPFHALRAQGLDGRTSPHKSVEEMAAHYLREIRAANPEGPYIFGGAGVGGMVAYEMAQQSTSKNGEVVSLVLMDTPPPSHQDKNIVYYMGRIAVHLKKGNVIKEIKNMINRIYRLIAAYFITSIRIYDNIQKVSDIYVPVKTYVNNVILFLPERREGYSSDPLDRVKGWYKYIDGKLDYMVVPGEHLEIFEEPNVQTLAKYLRKHIVGITNLRLSRAKR